MTDNGRNYKIWTILEDEKLVEALINMVNGGVFKADNGFKSGYLQYLEQALKESLPNAGILGKPHIESRIKTFKKDWQVVYDMVNGTNTSGFGYDNVKQCVIAEPEVWETYLAVHKGAAKWRNKQFPHYQDLCIVFGKDRATGNRARDFVEMANEANIEEMMQDLEGHSDELMDASHDGHNTTNVQSEEVSSARTRKRKSRIDSIIDGINNAASIIGSKIQEASETMNESLRAEVDLQKMTRSVGAEINKITSLSEADKFKATRKITREPDAVLSFWGYDGEARERFVKYVLEE